jgi:hypothetical protein
VEDFFEELDELTSPAGSGVEDKKKIRTAIKNDLKTQGMILER